MKKYIIIFLLIVLFIIFGNFFLLDTGYEENKDIDDLYTTDIEKYIDNSDNFILTIKQNEDIARKITVSNKSDGTHISYENVYYIKPANTEMSYESYMIHNGNSDIDNYTKINDTTYVTDLDTSFSSYSFDLLYHYLESENIKIRNIGDKEYNNKNVVAYEFKEYSDNYRFGLRASISGEFYVTESDNILVFYSIDNHETNSSTTFNFNSENITEKEIPEWLNSVQ